MQNFLRNFHIRQNQGLVAPFIDLYHSNYKVLEKSKAHGSMNFQSVGSGCLAVSRRCCRQIGWNSPAGWNESVESRCLARSSEAFTAAVCVQQRVHHRLGGHQTSGVGMLVRIAVQFRWFRGTLQNTSIGARFLLLRAKMYIQVIR